MKWVDRPDSPGTWVRMRTYLGTTFSPDLSFWLIVQAEDGLRFLTSHKELALLPGPTSLDDERERWHKLPPDDLGGST